MKKPAAAIGIAIATVALGVGLMACSSNSNSKSSTSSSATSSSSATKSSGPATTSAQASSNQTLDDYIKQNNIQQTVVHHGDQGEPQINLIVPDGWTKLEDSDQFPYGGVKYDAAADPNDPPIVAAKLRLLTGNVDAQQVLAVVHNGIKSAKGFSGGNGEPSNTGSYQGTQIQGTYMDDQGAQRHVAQKAVVFAGQGGLFVLQLVGDSTEAESGPLMDATKQIDEKLTITP